MPVQSPSTDPKPPLTAIADGLFYALRIAIALLLGAMVVLIFGNVVLRYVFNSGITVSEELARWFFVWLVFLGAVIGMRERLHLGVDMVVTAMPRLGRRLCFVVSHGLMLFATVLLTQGSWQQMRINWTVAAPATGLSTGIFYAAGVVFGAATAVIVVHELWRALTGRIRDEELVAVRETEEHVPS